MQTRLVNFVIPEKILALADKIAKKETRSRSELFREAIRRYIWERFTEEEDFKMIKKAGKRINMEEKAAFETIERIRDELSINK